MTFDLRMSIVTISPLEPALLIALLLTSPMAWYLGKGLGKVAGFVTDPWRRRLYLGPVWLAAVLVFFILPNILVILAYPVVHPDDREAIVCVAMVWPTFLVPAVLGVVAAGRTLRRSRNSAGSPA